MNTRDREKGTLSTLMAITLPVALAASGLVIDLGRMHSYKREMQNAADAAALAAAHEWRKENFSSYGDAAREDAALNGFDEDNGAEVDVNVPPASGTKAGDPDFLEVVIRQDAPMFFMRVFRSTPPSVSARAVAGLMPQDACLYVLDPHASAALQVAGLATVTLHDCGVQVNSDHSQGARSQGSATLTATSVGVVGDYSGTGFYPTPITGVVPAPDPLAYLQAPPSASCTYTEKQIIKTTMTLSPGVYCGGLEVTAAGNVTLQPGTYVIKGGGLKTQAGGYLSGTGVTFYVTEGTGYPWEPVDFHAGSTTNVSAPTSGPYKGILFYNDREVTATNLNLFAGTPSTQFTGVLYFPNTDVRFTGDSTVTAQQTMFVARKVEFQGNTTVEAYNLGRDFLPAGLSVARIVD